MLKPSERTGTRLGILALVCLAGVPIYAALNRDGVVSPSKNGMQFTERSTAASPPTRQEALNRLEVNKRQFRGTNGDPLTASFTLENKNDFAIKDFTVRFTFHGNSGSMIRSKSQTFYEIVPAGKSKSIKDVRLGFMPNQGVSVSTEVIDYGIP